MRILIAGACLLAVTGAAAKKPHLANPETVLCPKRAADLDYGIYTAMKAGGFQDDPQGGYQAYRKDATRVGDLVAVTPRYLRVHFVTFPTSDGTHMVAELSYVTAYKVEDVQDPKIIGAFQDMLDRFRAISPCP